MIAAYALPAVAVWSALGFAVTVVRLGWLALAAAVVYGGCYAATEISGRGLPPPGRSWQVPQTMLIEASARRRVLVWGAVLGPGFATRNPYAGFWLLPLAVASMPGTGAGLAAGAAVGLAHGAARAAALLRDVHDVHDLRALAVASDPGRGPGSEEAPVAAGQGRVPGGAAPGALITHLDVLLKTVYWRRLDGALLLAAAAMALAAWPGSVT
ncbi:MAG TPA: hypothetical protein VEM58_08765 [Streptosporangiaceae bacterium]|nr:hypothetical protein [Streptosporangiaceae bacterium]